MRAGSSTSNRRLVGEGGKIAAMVIPSGTRSHAKYRGSPLAIRPQYKWPTPADNNDSANATHGTRRDKMSLAILVSSKCHKLAAWSRKTNGKLPIASAPPQTAQRAARERSIRQIKFNHQISRRWR